MAVGPARKKSRSSTQKNKGKTEEKQVRERRRNNKQVRQRNIRIPANAKNIVLNIEDLHLL